MNREGLLQNPLPIDRVARRVTKAAAPENLWAPMPTLPEHHKFSKEVLMTQPLPRAAPPQLLAVVGRRRGSLTIVGYAKEQGSKKGQAKWVTRCDCGNYEHRTRILRWLGTDADDQCVECQKRIYKKQGWRTAVDPADRRDDLHYLAVFRSSEQKASGHPLPPETSAKSAESLQDPV
jgi:hypothetical protein